MSVLLSGCRRLGLVCLVLLVAPAAATAASSAVYDDPANDAVYPGVDIKRIALAYTDDGVVGIGVSTNVLIGGNRLAVYVDSDLNDATGFSGADYALFYERYINGQSLGYWVWNGSAWQMGAPATLAYDAGDYGVNMVIHASELGSPTAGIDVFARGGHANPIGVGTDYWDTAPNVGQWRLDFAPPSAVGGTGGAGGPSPSPAPVAPVAALTLAEAKATMRRGMRKRIGRRAKVGVRRCRRLSAIRVRCRVTARRGALSWKGSAAVTERATAAGVSRAFAFRGKRTDVACLRRARTSQGTGGACVRRVRL